MLSYESTGRVGASAARALLKEAASISREWWRAPLGLEPEREAFPAALRGRTALFHRQHSIPDEDDLFMAFADAVFILERLAEWAKRFKIKWRLRMYDDDWGAVDPSGYTKPLLDQMDKWAGRAKAFAAGKGKGEWSVMEPRRADLLARHAGRKEV